jgi:hypothetical protein
MNKQMTELLAAHGPTDLLWIDQYNNNYTVNDWPDILRHMKSLQPSCIVIANNCLDSTKTDIHGYKYPLLKATRAEKHHLPPPDNKNPAEVCDKRRANCLANVAPDRSVLIPGYAVERLRQIGRLLEEKGK